MDLKNSRFFVEVQVSTQLKVFEKNLDIFQMLQDTFVKKI